MERDLMERLKTALFIGGANLHATAKALGFDIDYGRLLQEFQGRGALWRAFYYARIIEDQDYSSLRPSLVRGRGKRHSEEADDCRVLGRKSIAPTCLGSCIAIGDHGDCSDGTIRDWQAMRCASPIFTNLWQRPAS
jgi:hypothetical protein